MRKLKSILKNVKTIAIVGASSDPSRDSFKVMKYMIDNGYKVFPVNPHEVEKEIFGIKFFSKLELIHEKIDMVDIFRSSEHVRKITEDAIKLNIKVIWTQEGVIDEESAILAKKFGVNFIMNNCPKKVLEN